MPNPKLVLYPVTAEINAKNHLVIGGCDTIDLAAQYGTPLYVFDEAGLRGQCTRFREEFTEVYPNTTVVYASKAFINKTLVRLIQEEGLGLDVVSGGEMSIARAAGFLAEKVFFHGNNKSAVELKMALEWGIGRIVVDNFYELELLQNIAREKGIKAKILLRISPGIDPHTHHYIATGVVDSKFGFLMDRAEEAVSRALKSPNLELLGLHSHLGSLLFETEVYTEGVKVMLNLAAALKKKFGFILKELNIGGGFAVQYDIKETAPPPAVYAEVVIKQIKDKCREYNLDLPQLIIEPGRAIVARSGIALYTVGASKDIPGVRRYISVDGGMADNIRPALYGSHHEIMAAGKVNDTETETVTVAGKFCESGDILLKDATLPVTNAGDILAVADCGAYCLAMASNYNASLKPAVIMVKEGKARLIRRRETYEDLSRLDM